MNTIFHYISWFWLGCSAFNLVIFLIFIHDYKTLTERSLSRARGNNVTIPINEFIPWVLVAATVLGSIASIAIVKNIISVGKPFNLNDESN